MKKDAEIYALLLPNFLARIATPTKMGSSMSAILLFKEYLLGTLYFYNKHHIGKCVRFRLKYTVCVNYYGSNRLW